MYIYQLTQINDSDPTQQKLKTEQHNQMLQGQTNFKNIVSKGWYKQITAEQLPRFSFVVFQMPSENEAPTELVQHVFYNVQIIESTTELSGDNQVPITLYRFVAEYVSETVTTFKSVDELMANGLLTQDNQISFKPQAYMFQSDASTLSNLFAKHSSNIQTIYAQANKDYITKDGLAISEYVLNSTKTNTGTTQPQQSNNTTQDKNTTTGTSGGTSGKEEPKTPVQSTTIKFTQNTPVSYLAIQKSASTQSTYQFQPVKQAAYILNKDLQTLNNKIIYIMPGQKVTVKGTASVSAPDSATKQLLGSLSGNQTVTSYKLQDIDISYKSGQSTQSFTKYAVDHQKVDNMAKKDKSGPSAIYIQTIKTTYTAQNSGNEYSHTYNAYICKQTYDLLIQAKIPDIYHFWSPMHSAAEQYPTAIGFGTPIYMEKYNDDGATYNDFVLIQITGQDKKKTDPTHIAILGVISTKQATVQQMTKDNTIIRQFFFNPAANTHNQIVMPDVTANKAIFKQSARSSSVSLSEILRYTIPSGTVTPFKVVLPEAKFKVNPKQSKFDKMKFELAISQFTNSNDYITFQSV